MQLQSLRNQTKQTVENKHLKCEHLTRWCKIIGDKQQRTRIKIKLFKQLALRASDIYSTCLRKTIYLVIPNLLAWGNFNLREKKIGALSLVLFTFGKKL